MEDGLDVPEVSSGLNIFFFFFWSYLPTGELRGNYFHDKEIFHRFFFFLCYKLQGIKGIFFIPAPLTGKPGLFRALSSLLELPRWLSGKESACQCRRPRFDPWIGKIPLEKETATHSSTLAWEILWTGQPGGLSAIALLRAEHE